MKYKVYVNIIIITYYMKILHNFTESDKLFINCLCEFQNFFETINDISMSYIQSTVHI